jgi:hypothetical protein
MLQAYDLRQAFVVALDNDRAGERGRQKAWNETVQWAGLRPLVGLPETQGLE